MKDYYTITVPFAHRPEGLPDWAPGYSGHGRNGTFKAAGVCMDIDANAAGMVTVDLRNLTSRGNTANQAVVMPPAVMDDVASQWLINRNLVWRRIIAMGLMGFEVTTEQPYTTQDGVVIPERTKGKVVAQLTPINQAIVLLWVEFGEEKAVISATELFDQSKFYLGFSF